ncbi:MAG: hypothetical protein GY772_02115 [bacterium]|nr:hypothetical protein [bacterium]
MSPIEDHRLRCSEMTARTRSRLEHMEDVPVTRKSHVVCFDVRVFHDPDAGDLHGHVGFHPEIIRRAVDSATFLPWLSEVKGLVVPTLQGPWAPALVFACNKGRHRSVALALIVAHILEMEGYLVHRTHAMKDTWHRGTCAGQCMACARPSARRTEALAKAHRLWSDA